MRAVARGGLGTHIREFAVKVDSGIKKKIPCHTRESNPRQWRAGSTLCQLSYTLSSWGSLAFEKKHYYIGQPAEAFIDV